MNDEYRICAESRTNIMNAEKIIMQLNGIGMRWVLLRGNAVCLNMHKFGYNSVLENGLRINFQNGGIWAENFVSLGPRCKDLGCLKTDKGNETVVHSAVFCLDGAAIFGRWF